jgi:hypothetical protein
MGVVGGSVTYVVLYVSPAQLQAPLMVAAGTALLGGCLAFLYGMHLRRPQGGSRISPSSPDFKTTDGLAFSLMTLFFATLLLAYFGSHDAETGKEWRELFKSGSVLFGGALTTVVGYYFGSRTAKESGQEVVKQAVATVATASAQAERISLKEEEAQAPTTDEEALDN